jgi:ClpP class serine protease
MLYLRKIPAIIFSHQKLLMTADAYSEAIIPILSNDMKGVEDHQNSYKEMVTSLLKKMDMGSINLTDDYSNSEIASGSLAYYRIEGMIVADPSYWWYFSTKQFEFDLLAAEQNPNIYCHFIHVTSGGGEAWYMDQISATLSGLSKPIYVYVEKICGSGAYYIACHGDIIKACTQNDTIGSIGCMISFFDFTGYYQNLGIKLVEEYATQSDLKNKKTNDLIDGNPKQFIEEELNPIAEQFIAEVRASRPQLADIPDDNPIFRGEVFQANIAVDNGMIDGITTFSQAIEEAAELGKTWHANQQITNFLN